MIDADTLRSLVRDVIATELAEIRRATKVEMPAASPGDSDRSAFAREVLRLAEDPTKRSAILAGTYTFTAPVPSGTSATIAKGVVTEAALVRLPKGTLRLLLAEGVTVTPLAKDRARRLGITIERTKP